jgi:hypothetical protein
VLVVDPQARLVSWLKLDDGEYQPIEHSGLVDLGTQGLAAGRRGLVDVQTGVHVGQAFTVT